MFVMCDITGYVEGVGEDVVQANAQKCAQLQHYYNDYRNTEKRQSLSCAASTHCNWQLASVVACGVWLVMDLCVNFACSTIIMI